MIRKSRNELIFAKRNAHPMEDVRRAVDANVEWHKNVIDTSSGKRRPFVQSSKWEPPPTDWIKCNFDYSSGSDTVKGGIGWILRNHNGEFMEAGGAQVLKAHSSLEGEALGFLFALQQIWVRGWRKVWFEGDNQELCNIINQVKEHVVLGNLLWDIRHWMKLLPECSLEHINREMNQAADCIAKKTAQQNCLYFSYHFPPAWLIDFLYYPYTPSVSK